MEFDECVHLGRLAKIPPNAEFAKSELKEANSDLQHARQSLSQASWKWATDAAYYAMFHAAKALLYLKGYKERHSHACTIVALNELFVKTGRIESKFADYINAGKKRREEAIYDSNYSEEIARKAVEIAGEFLEQAENILTA